MSATSAPAFRAVAGIVTFHPDPAELVALVRAVAPDAVAVVVYANSPLGPDLAAALTQAVRPALLDVIDPGANLGLGTAYDAIVAAAARREAEFVLLLDQDSAPAPGLIATLAARHRALADAGQCPALVGPQPVDSAGTPMRIPLVAGAAEVSGAARVHFAISSGSLLRLATAREIGPFRADFFIDAIDLEWCMRAIDRGFTVWIARDVAMPHRLGQGLIRLPGGLLLTDQPPRRLYTYLRNQIAMLGLAHVPLAHKAKFVVSLPLRLAAYLAHNRFSADSRAAIRNGIADGLRGRLGPPDRALVRGSRGG